LNGTITNTQLDLKIRPATNADCHRVQRHVFGILQEYGLTPDIDRTDRDLADIEGNYLNRGGRFDLIENAEGELLGTIGLYPLTENTIELRKMYFAKELRGRGVGKQELSRMIETARCLGYKLIYLETATVLTEAVGLYEKFGFRPTSERHTPRCDQAYVLHLTDEGTQIQD